MRTHLWHLPRLGCALQGLLPLLPPMPDAPERCSTYNINPQHLTSDCHLIDDIQLGNVDRNTKGLIKTTNNQLSFNR